MNMSYEDSLKLLKNTSNVVELTVSQIFSEYQRKIQQQQQQQHQLRNLQPQHVMSLSNCKTYEQNPNRKCIQPTTIEHPQRMTTFVDSSPTTYAYEQNFSYNDNDNDNEIDNNNQDITVLETEQLSKIACDAPNSANYSHCTDTKSFTKHGFNDRPDSTDALNFSRREFSDSCLISANCMPDLPKVNLYSTN